MTLARASHDPPHGTGGFSIAELIVVLAVLVLLTGIAVPLMSGRADLDKRDRTMADIRAIGAAVESFYRDVGSWPARRAGKDNALFVLCSGDEFPEVNPFTQPHQLTNWLLDAMHGDLLDYHLLDNRPGGTNVAAYPTQGSAHWRGPYVERSTPFDAWGRPYLVTVISGHSRDSDSFKRLLVLSAGPNGQIDTNGRLGATTEPGGDDLGLIISQRL